MRPLVLLLLGCMAAVGVGSRWLGGARGTRRSPSALDERRRRVSPLGSVQRLRGGAGEAMLGSTEALSFNDSLPWMRYVRTHGVRQFISIFQRQQSVTGDELFWGDEIEYQIIAANATARTVRLSLRAGEHLAELQAKRLAGGRPERSRR